MSPLPLRQLSRSFRIRPRPRDRRLAAHRFARMAAMIQETYKHHLWMRTVHPGTSRLLPADSSEITRSWSLRLLELLNVQVRVTGAAPMTTPGVYVSNHTAYTDVFLWFAITDCSFVAKAAIRKAPIVGPGAERIGIVFVNRNSKRSRGATRQAIADAVENEDRRVVVFPEGTTSYEGGPWRRGTFEVAAECGFPIQHAAICYSDVTLCADVDKSIPRHAWDLAGSDGIEAHIHLFEPMEVRDPDAAREHMHSEVMGWLDEKFVEVGYTPQGRPTKLWTPGSRMPRPRPRSKRGG